MKSIVAFRFSTEVIAVNSRLKAGISHLINSHHHYKKRKNNELHIFTT
jgi:hypothetical protein